MIGIFGARPPALTGSIKEREKEKNRNTKVNSGENNVLSVFIVGIVADCGDELELAGIEGMDML